MAWEHPAVRSRLVRHLLASIALRLWPGLDTLDEDRRKSGVCSVAGFLIVAPFALAGLVWLASVTDPVALWTRWPMLASALVLVLALEWLGFSSVVEVMPGTYSEWRVSFAWVIVWSATLLFGPGALWLAVLPILVSTVVRLWCSPTPLTRWTAACDGTLELAQTTFASWIALALYRGLGGVFPLAGLGEFPRAFAATALRWLVAALLSVPGLVQFALSRGLAGHIMRKFVQFCAAAVGWRIMVDPFAILVAGLYVQSGLGGYLFLAAGLLLASLVAHQLSRAVERGQHRARELEKLEQFGRALIGMAPDSSALPQVLKAHVSDMFPHSQMDVVLFADQVLLHHPAEQPPLEAVAWEWLRTTAQPRCFVPGQRLPWSGQRLERGVVAVPILELGSSLPVGGIYLARDRRPREIANALPAVQALAAEISSALHSAQLSTRRLAQERVEQELGDGGTDPGQFPAPGGSATAGQCRRLERGRRAAPGLGDLGRFFDVFPLPNSRFAIVVADVADKAMSRLSIWP